MKHSTANSVFSPERIAALTAAEKLRFQVSHPESLRLQAQVKRLMPGTTGHDDGIDTRLFIRQAQGARLHCADALTYDDFSLGDQSEPFGHSPMPVVAALAASSHSGLACGLPVLAAIRVAERMGRVFGLPSWQTDHASVLLNQKITQWAPGLTGCRRIVLVEGAYAGLSAMVIEPDIEVIGVPFNDVSALQSVLAGNDIACVMLEPALTGQALIAPAEGYLLAVQDCCKRSNALLALDETHTFTAALGGLAAQAGVVPDFLVLGNGLASGLPMALCGIRADLASRLRSADGLYHQSFIRNDLLLCDQPLRLQILEAMLDSVMTTASIANGLELAVGLSRGLEELIRNHRLPWSVVRVGGAVQLHFCELPPQNERHALQVSNLPLASLLRLGLINRGVLVPTEGPWLTSCASNHGQVARLLTSLSELLTSLAAADL